MSENMNSGWFCPTCGNFGNTGNFCGKCGAAKPVQTYAPQTAAPAPQGMTFSDQDKKRANARCIISLILTIGVPLVEGIILAISEGIGYDAYDLYRLSALLSIPVCGATIAGIVLMIIVHVKYRKSKFGLILMILYCVIYAVAIILFIIGVTTECSSFIGSSSCS